MVHPVSTPGEKLFPIQTQRGAAPHPLRIPWRIAELAYSVYAANYGRGQSLERLADRGGFGPVEMDTFLPGWREMCEQDAVRKAMAEEREACLAAVRACKGHPLGREARAVEPTWDAALETAEDAIRARGTA